MFLKYWNLAINIDKLKDKHLNKQILFYFIYLMYSLNFAFREKTKKITLPRNINAQDLMKLIGKSFRLNENIAGFTNNRGQLIST